MRPEIFSSLFDHSGPFATVYIDVRERTEDRNQVIDLRWAGLLDQLRDSGADKDTVDALVEAVGNHSRSGVAESIAVVASHGQVALELTIPEEVPGTCAWMPVPALVPALRHLPEPIPHLVCLVDRTRAEIHVPQWNSPWSEHRGEGHSEVRDVDGDSRLPLRKVSAGGWSMARYQQRAEEAWQQNARSMVGAIAEAIEETHAQVVILAGDVRERAIVRDELANVAGQCAIVSVEEGGLGAGAALEPLFERVAQVLEERRAKMRGDLAERIGLGMSRDEPLALRGIRPIVDACRRGQVAHLLLGDTETADSSVWVGTSPEQIGMDRDEVLGLGAERAFEAPALDAIAWSALGLGAEVSWVGGQVDMSEGVGALLRFSDESTARMARSASADAR
jgi:hypothetical protein